MTDEEDSKTLQLDPQTAAVFKKKGYEAHTLLNHGAFGWVYKGKSIKGGFPVAIKVMDLEEAGRIIEMKYFPREMEALISIEHKHVITIYDIFKANRTVYTFMEFASNGDLHGYIKTSGAIKESGAGFWFAQVCEALCFMHDKLAIAHRDIKVENILLTDQLRTAKLTDFGFAIRVNHSEDGRAELSKSFCGTAPYQCVQIYKRIPYCPFAADCWAMGVTLFFMLNYAFPFWVKGLENNAQLVARDMKHGKHKERYTKELSDDVKTILDRFFEVKEKNRMTMKEILKTKWVRNKGKGFDVER